MSETPRNPAASAPEPEVRKRRGPSIVWLIPIVALAIGAGVAYRTLASKGPTITISFPTGEGLEEGKTKIKFKEVEVGVVTQIDFGKDLESVIATAELHPQTKEHLNENTVFWRVSPRVSLSGISGLGTLVSGQYIAMLPKSGDPNKKGKRKRAFEALKSPPITAGHEGALGLELTADKLGSVGPGDNVTYRSITVGEVEKYEMLDDGRRFKIHVLVDNQYAHLVKQSTQFWNASGLKVSVGPQGLELDAASFASMLGGGIAFDTPAWAEGAPAAEVGHRFTLYTSPQNARKAREKSHGLNILVEARDGSIADGAPVYYRKREVGHVGESQLSPDATSVRYQVHIGERYKALVRSDTRFWNASGVQMHIGTDGLQLRTDSLASIIEGGLEFATPTRPGPQADSGAVFALNEVPEEEWLAWTPSLWFDGKGERAVAHVLPPPGAKARGLAIVLESFTTSSMKKGDHITYREVKVGEIGEHELSKDGKTVRIHGRIYPEYTTLVRDNTRFWNTSGISAHLGLRGLDVRTGSLESMLAGGVAFATPDEPGGRVKPGTIFPLHPEAKEEWEQWSPTLWVGRRPAGGEVEHAIAAETHRHLRRKRVESEAVAPPAMAEDGSVLPAVAAPPPEGSNGAEAQPEAEPDATPPKRRGFFRRIFHRGDKSQD